MSLLDLLKSRSLLPALTIGIIMHLSQQLSGRIIFINIIGIIKNVSSSTFHKKTPSLLPSVL